MVNVGKYTIHGAYGFPRASIWWLSLLAKPFQPGTPNNKFKVDVWWNNDCPCKDLVHHPFETTIKNGCLGYHFRTNSQKWSFEISAKHINHLKWIQSPQMDPILIIQLLPSVILLILLFPQMEVTFWPLFKGHVYKNTLLRFTTGRTWTVRFLENLP